MSRVMIRPTVFKLINDVERQNDSLGRALTQFGTNTIAEAYRAATFSLSAGANKIPLDTVITDPNTLFDTTNHRYIVPTAGAYSMQAQVDMTYNVASTGTFFTSIYLNGVENKRGSRHLITTTDVWGSTVSAIIAADAGSYFELWCFVSAAATIAISSGATTYMTIARVA